MIIILLALGEMARVAAIYQTNLFINFKSKHGHGLFGQYSEFLSEFSKFVSNLVFRIDKVLIGGDFNIHIDLENDSLRNHFINMNRVSWFLPTDKSTNSKM